jgi:hypothetical protein
MKPLHSFACAVFALTAVLTLASVRDGQAASPTEGAILGQVRDLDSGQPVGGVTVVASGPEGDVAALTDAKGIYQFHALPLGRYTVRFHRNEVLAEREATVSVDKTVRVNMRLPAVPAEVQAVAATYSPPLIDVGSSRIGATFGADFIDGIPNAGADVASLMQKAPGAYDDTPPTSAAYQGNPGLSLSGGTGADNAYYLEGLNVTALRDGMLATNLHVAFLEEVEVVSAGYGAEYGRALGGVVNMALKSGTNEWKGSAFSWVQPGWMAGSQQRILSSSTVLTGTTEPVYTTQMGAEVGGPIIKDKLFIWVGYVPEIGRSSLIQSADQSTTNPDGSTTVQPLYSRVIPGESTTQNYAGKLTWRIRPNQTLSLSLVGIRKDQEYMRGANMDLLAGMTHDKSSRQDIMAHWQSAFFERHWRLDATLGLHTEGYSQRSPYGDAESANQVTWNNYPSLAQFNPLVASLCTSPQSCPVYGYQSGGYGEMSDVSAIRVAGQIKSTNVFEALGMHELKYGLDYEVNQYDEKVWYSGVDGARGMLTVKSDGSLQAQSLYGLAGYQDSSEAKNRAYNTGAFIQESYLPLSNLTVNVGLRWEAQRLTDSMGNTALSISDSFAPRIGVVYDPTKEGRSKVFVHFGQYYESIPMDLANRSFGGKGGTTTNYDPSACQVQSWSPTACQSPDSHSGVYPKLPVQPNIKGSYNNEIVAGGQYQYWHNLVVGASFIRRWLGRVIEDGGASYADPNNLTLENPPNGARLPDGTPVSKPERTYTALQLTATKRFAKNWFFAGAYTYSRTMGNYAGLYDSGIMPVQLNPNNSMQYDYNELTKNTYGPLPNDRPHLIHMDGYYRFVWGQHSLSPGLSFMGRSGQPISPLGADPYGYTDYVFPRGSAGRTPFVTQLDMHLAYRTKLSTALSVEAFIDIFNVLNQKTVLTVDSLYTPDQVMPANPGTPATVANNDGSSTSTPVRPNPNYLHATSYQLPISGRLGARVWF